MKYSIHAGPTVFCLVLLNVLIGPIYMYTHIYAVHLILLLHIVNPVPDLEKGRLGVAMYLAVLGEVHMVLLPLLESFGVISLCGPHFLICLVYWCF